jgi:hypothetical protein
VHGIENPKLPNRLCGYGVSPRSREIFWWGCPAEKRLRARWRSTRGRAGCFLGAASDPLVLAELELI